MHQARDSARSIEILLVEDNPGDVHLTLEALKDARVSNTVHSVTDGEAAMRYLHSEGEFTGAARPDLILLDLNLPRMDGHEVLAQLKRDPLTQTIPVVVLTSSDREADVVASYELQANCHVTKPVEADDFVSMIRSITEFWFGIAQLPSGVQA